MNKGTAQNNPRRLFQAPLGVAREGDVSSELVIGRGEDHGQYTIDVDLAEDRRGPLQRNGSEIRRLPGGHKLLDRQGENIAVLSQEIQDELGDSAALGAEDVGDKIDLLSFFVLELVIERVERIVVRPRREQKMRRGKGQKVIQIRHRQAELVLVGGGKVRLQGREIRKDGIRRSLIGVLAVVISDDDAGRLRGGFRPDFVRRVDLPGHSRQAQGHVVGIQPLQRDAGINLHLLGDCLVGRGHLHIRHAHVDGCVGGVLPFEEAGQRGVIERVIEDRLRHAPKLNEERLLAASGRRHRLNGIERRGDRQQRRRIIEVSQPGVGVLPREILRSPGEVGHQIRIGHWRSQRDPQAVLGERRSSLQDLSQPSLL